MYRLFITLVLLAVAFSIPGKEKEKTTKSPVWPPKAGIRTPGIQIPFTSLKAEAEWKTEGVPDWLLVQGPNALLPLNGKGEIVRMQNRDNKMTDAWKAGESLCGGLISAFEHVWAADCGKQSLLKLAARDAKVVASIATSFTKGAKPVLAANADSIWVLSDEAGTLSRIDPVAHRIVHEIRVGAGCNTIHFEQDMLWITCPGENRLVKVNPHTNLVDKRIETAAGPQALAFGEGHLWVLGGKEGKISKIDPKTDKVVATIETGVPGVAGSLAFGDGALWVSQPGYPLTKIDAKTDKVLQQFAGEGASLVRVAFGSVWLLDAAKMQVQRFDPKRIAATLPD